MLNLILYLTVSFFYNGGSNKLLKLASHKRVKNHMRHVWHKKFHPDIRFALNACLLFISPPARRPDGANNPAEAWFGLKTFIESNTPLIKLLGWMAIVGLSAAIIIASCLAVSRLVTLWDYWFEEVRRPDSESAFKRYMRIISFWLAVMGMTAWATCKLLTQHLLP